VLELCKEVLGPKHPDTIRAMANLAATWWQQGRSNEAEPLQVEVLELYKEVLGPKHPDTIRAMANLATINQQSTCDKDPDSDQQEKTRTKPYSRGKDMDKKVGKVGKK
jgi:hypothetical protein